MFLGMAGRFMLFPEISETRRVGSAAIDGGGIVGFRAFDEPEFQRLA